MYPPFSLSSPLLFFLLLVPSPSSSSSSSSDCVPTGPNVCATKGGDTDWYQDACKALQSQDNVLSTDLLCRFYGKSVSSPLEGKAMCQRECQNNQEDKACLAQPVKALCHSNGNQIYRNWCACNRAGGDGYECDIGCDMPGAIRTGENKNCDDRCNASHGDELPKCCYLETGKCKNW